VTDNETNLAKWTAFAASSDPEAVGHTLNELAGEIERLRGVCIMAAEALKGGTCKVTQVRAVIADLMAEGSKDGK